MQTGTACTLHSICQPCKLLLSEESFSNIPILPAIFWQHALVLKGGDVAQDI